MLKISGQVIMKSHSMLTKIKPDDPQKIQYLLEVAKGYQEFLKLIVHKNHSGNSLNMRISELVFRVTDVLWTRGIDSRTSIPMILMLEALEMVFKILG